MNRRSLILDMDGTIADTYHYPDWVGILRGHVDNPWERCGEVKPSEVYKMFCNLEPLVTPTELYEFCKQFPHTIIYTMAPWDATPDVEIATKAGKLLWLDKYFPWLKRNLVITKHKREKNLIQPDMLIFKHTLSWPFKEPDWSPQEYDTLVDDNDELLKSFIGKSMRPPWLK